MGIIVQKSMNGHSVEEKDKGASEFMEMQRKWKRRRRRKSTENVEKIFATLRRFLGNSTSQQPLSFPPPQTPPQ